MSEFAEVRCTNPKCDNRIFRKSQGAWKFSVRVLKVNDDGSNVVAVCKSCGREVELDMIVIQPVAEMLLQKSEPTRTSPPKPGRFCVVEIKKP